MQVPESQRLFCKTITAEPGKLVIAGVVETADPSRHGIGDFLIDDEFFHGQAVKEKIGKRIRPGDTIIPLTDIFLFCGGGAVTIISCILASGQQTAKKGTV